MKVCWFDIETTGLNPDKNQILEIGILIDDLDKVGTTDEIPLGDLPSFHCYVLPSGGGDLVGNPIALSMNAGILEKIAKKIKGKEPVEGNFFENHEVFAHITGWLIAQGAGKLSDTVNKAPITIVAGGKNFARFDEKFLSKLPYWGDNIRVRHRVLDPVNFFIEPGDTEPPDLAKCLERAGLIADVPHTAVEDAALACAVYRVGVRRLLAARDVKKPITTDPLPSGQW